MRNPLENEETAFRFVLGTIVYFAPIVLASWIATWLGVLVFVVATAVAVKVLRGSTAPASAGPPVGPAPRALVEDTRRILVLAAAAADPRLRDAVVRLADGFAEDVLVVVPASGAGDGGPESVCVTLSACSARPACAPAARSTRAARSRRSTRH